MSADDVAAWEAKLRAVPMRRVQCSYVAGCTNPAHDVPDYPAMAALVAGEMARRDFQCRESAKAIIGPLEAERAALRAEVARLRPKETVDLPVSLPAPAFDVVWADEGGVMVRFERMPHNGGVRVTIIKDDVAAATAGIGDWRWERIVRAMAALAEPRP